MKKFSIITVLLLLCLTILSCRNDDETQKNFLKIGSTEYKITDGLLENYGTSTNYQGNNVDLTLFTEGTTLAVNGGTVSVTGNGMAIYFESFTTAKTYLDNGDFVYTTTSPYPVKSFDYASYADIANGTPGSWKPITAGKFNVNRNGDTYEITINTTDNSGNAITGYYKGSLKYSDQE